MSGEYEEMQWQDPVRVGQLLARVGVALKMSHGQLAKHLGFSRRTVSRWTLQGSRLTRGSVLTLVRLAHPHDRALAEELAGLVRETLVNLRLEEPPPPAAAPVPPPLEKLADAAVCAAAEALDMSPRLVRPAILAALRSAREAGLGAAQLEELLAARIA